MITLAHCASRIRFAQRAVRSADQGVVLTVTRNAERATRSHLAQYQLFPAFFSPAFIFFRVLVAFIMAPTLSKLLALNEEMFLFTLSVIYHLKRPKKQREVT